MFVKNNPSTRFVFSMLYTLFKIVRNLCDLSYFVHPDVAL